MHPVELAARTYQRFISIHPFADGNGRTGRHLMNWVLRQHGYPPATLVGDEVSQAIFGVQVVAGRDHQSVQAAVEAVTRGIERTIGMYQGAGI